MAMAQVLKLKPAFTDAQAEALAGLFDDEIATKSDLEKLRLELSADIQKLRLELKAGEDSLRGDIQKLRLELKAGEDSLRGDIQKLGLEFRAGDDSLRGDIEKLRLEVQRDLKGTEARLVTWVVGQGAATIGILFALQHVFGK